MCLYLYTNRFCRSFFFLFVILNIKTPKKKKQLLFFPSFLVAELDKWVNAGDGFIFRFVSLSFALSLLLPFSCLKVHRGSCCLSDGEPYLCFCTTEKNTDLIRAGLASRRWRRVKEKKKKKKKTHTRHLIQKFKRNRLCVRHVRFFFFFCALRAILHV